MGVYLADGSVAGEPNQVGLCDQLDILLERGRLSDTVTYLEKIKKKLEAKNGLRIRDSMAGAKRG